MKKLEFKPGTHAGPLDEESLDEIWDHLIKVDEELEPPVFTPKTLEFFAEVHGAVPRSAYVNGLRITRFLNFCNYYFPANAAIANWHVVRNRKWIADRLDPLVIPIAELAHGDFLCLDFAEGNEPKVLRWVHERSKPGRPAYDPVAEDLDTFVSLIEIR